jgi:hypothetical protein
MVFLGAMGHLVGLSSKNYEILLPEVKITVFILLYIYIVLHSHVKSYIYIYMILHIYTHIYTVLSDRKKLYKLFIFTLTQSVIPKPFTCTTLLPTKVP